MQISNLSRTNSIINSNLSKDSTKNETQKSFGTFLGETYNQKVKKIDALLKDIDSVIRTGLSVNELKELQKLIQEIKEHLKKGDMSEEDLRDMIKELEKAIYQYQIRMGGKVIKKAKDINSQPTDLSVQNFQTLQMRVENAQDTLEKIIKGSVKKHDYSDEKSKLLQKLKNFQ